jgi:hypothetical protein
MAVSYPAESAIAKELWRWDHTTSEHNPHDSSLRGVRPPSPQEFPKMLYRASRPATGGKVTFEQLIVDDSQVQRNFESRGYHCRQEDALAALESDELAVAKLAAERHYQERSMSEKAQREVAAHEAETDAHLPVIPDTPVKRRGRPKTVESVE